MPVGLFANKTNPILAQSQSSSTDSASPSSSPYSPSSSFTNKLQYSCLSHETTQLAQILNMPSKNLKDFNSNLALGDTTSPASQLSMTNNINNNNNDNNINNRLDSRPVLFVVLTQNDLNNLTSSNSNTNTSENKPSDYPNHQISDSQLTTQPTHNCSIQNSQKLNLNDLLLINKENNTNDLNNSNSGAESQIINDEEFKFLFNDASLDLTANSNFINSDEMIQHTTNSSNATISVKNNIDYAIDAVLAKCREEDALAEQESIDQNKTTNTNIPNQFNSNTNSYPETSSFCQPSSSSSSSSCSTNLLNIEDLLRFQTNETDETNSFLFINTSGSTSNTIESCSQELPSVKNEQTKHKKNFKKSKTQTESPNFISSSETSSSSHTQAVDTSNQTKSTKARTSYISSLIANRDKSTSKSDEEPKLNDDKQKKISQNILSILASSSPSCSSSTSSSASSSNSSISTCTNSKPAKSLHNQIPIYNNQNTSTTNIQIQPKPIQPQSQQQQFSNAKQNTKLSKIESSHSQNQSSFSSLSSLASTPAYSSIDFVLNKKLFDSNLIQTTTQQAKSTSDLITTNLNFSNQNSNIASRSNVCQVDCSNLKRLLSQSFSNDSSMNLSEQSLNDCLLESSFDKSLIKITLQRADEAQNKHASLIESIKEKPTVDLKETSALNSDSLSTICNTPKNKLITKERKLKQIKSADEQEPKQNPVIEQQAVKATKKPIKRKRVTSTNSVEKHPESSNQFKSEPIETKQETSRPKKLKTIADIVKHHQTTNRLINNDFSVKTQTNTTSAASNPESNQNQQQDFDLMRSQQQQQETSNQIESRIKNEDLTITWINQNHLMDNLYSHNHHHQQISNTNTSSSVETSDMTNMNIDHLIELELNASQQSPIDRYIDLDDIDINPLDCYRNSNSNRNSQQMSSLAQHSNSTNSQAHLDEFNLQFSVCSSSSSGFSEPSNFSCSSSMSSSSASNLGYGNCASNVRSVNSINNCLFSPDESSPCAAYQYETHHSPISANSSQFNQSQIERSNEMVHHNSHQIDWNMIEFTKNLDQHDSENCQQINNRQLIDHFQNSNDLINDQTTTNNAIHLNNNNVNNNLNCGENLFGNFNFFNDEIKLQI